MASSPKLAELWQRLGYRVIAVCMGSESKVDRVSDTLTIHYRKDLFLKDPWNYGIAFGFAGYVRRLIRKEKPDVIVANKLLFWSSLCVIPLTFTGHRVLVLTDALVGMTWWPRGKIPQLCAAIYAWTFGWLILLCADRVVTFHPQPEGLLRRLGIAKKTQVIPTGIDAGAWGVGGRGLGNTVNVTYVGRLESIKGVDDFLAAVVPMKKYCPSLSVQVIGWFEPGHPLVTEYAPEVNFTGLRDDIPKILAECDIFVLPSHSEGLSNALMEAMASGCACIATDVGGNRFLIQNGVSGFLYPAGDRAALAAHVRRLIEDPVKRKAMGEAARKRIEEQFDWGVVGKKYEKLFA
ncbi:glycosyltransferase [Candidatus Peregrinibacteria bacterium]|nr:glycosyltransferase [Candidatus Peregrinibacteria bacterium]